MLFDPDQGGGIQGRAKFLHSGGCHGDRAACVLQSPVGGLSQNLGAPRVSGRKARAVVLPGLASTLWKLPKNILLTSGRSKVTSCKVALGSRLK